MGSKLEDKLINIIQELQPLIGIDKQTFLMNNIKFRLNRCLALYHDQLDSTIERLGNYNEKYMLKIVKMLNKD